jgi:hypothetical protein
VVLTLGVRHAWALDPEVGHTAAIRAPDLDGLKLPASDQPVGAEEEIVGLQRGFLLPRATHLGPGMRREGIS